MMVTLFASSAAAAGSYSSDRLVVVRATPARRTTYGGGGPRLARRSCVRAALRERRSHARRLGRQCTASRELDRRSALHARRRGARLGGSCMSSSVDRVAGGSSDPAALRRVARARSHSEHEATWLILPVTYARFKDSSHARLSSGPFGAETANGSIHQLWFIRSCKLTW